MNLQVGPAQGHQDEACCCSALRWRSGHASRVPHIIMNPMACSRLRPIQRRSMVYALK